MLSIVATTEADREVVIGTFAQVVIGDDTIWGTTDCGSDIVVAERRDEEDEPWEVVEGEFAYSTFGELRVVTR